MSADDAEFRKFINLTHAHAMANGGTITSDDEAET
jgi:hypothetical protein